MLIDTFCHARLSFPRRPPRAANKGRRRGFYGSNNNNDNRCLFRKPFRRRRSLRKSVIIIIRRALATGGGGVTRFAKVLITIFTPYLHLQCIYIRASAVLYTAAVERYSNKTFSSIIVRTQY